MLHANSSGSRRKRRGSTPGAAARHYRTTRKSPPNIEGVFGFARCMAENRAFIARQGNGEKGTVFVGYEQACRTTGEWCCWMQRQT